MQLHCCAVLENNWSAYRASRWFQNQGGIEGMFSPRILKLKDTFQCREFIKL